MNPSDLMDLLGFTTGQIERMALVMTRLTGLFLSAPFFSRSVGPFRLRAALLALTTLVVAPLVPPWPGEGKGDVMQLAIALLGELILGAVIGIVIHWALIALQTAGNIAGFEMGLSMAQVMDPTSGMQENVLSNLLYLAGLMIFLTLNGHHWMLEGLVRTFQTFPPGKAFPSSGVLLEVGTVGVARYFTFALLIAAPVVVSSKLLYLGLGLINRASPQIQVFFIAMPVTLMLGIFLMGLTMALFGQVLTRELAAFMTLALKVGGV
ncbi:MAG: flagellar biosynthetic protein FliR [Magnetococcales bacterium]|nr:flagellar biosynthetic protein FliR [Magnetococcales bacterium]